VAPHVIVHGHFYQPPRENPWTGRIDHQPSAAPFPDWNERVHAECYQPNAYVKLETPEGKKLFNNYERISFDVGPTLLTWLESAHPETYSRIIEADEVSRSANRHGNALAQSYHHTILPLSPRRDVRTQIAWGLADFRHRFGRDSDGLWLPETAVSPSVLDELIEAGIRFTILSPRQAANWRHYDGKWADARRDPVDTTFAHSFRHSDGSGRTIAVFFYDDAIARAIAFERAASSAAGFLRLFTSRSGCMAGAATDGETYGHHLKFGDIGLAYALFVEAPKAGIKVTNYAEWLERHPPEREVMIAEGLGTSWSCAHGVGRWMRDCGCSTGGEPGWNQQWRTPLRLALEVVRDAADEAFGRVGRSLFVDPWGARDRYIDVLLGAIPAGDFLAREAGRPLESREEATALSLLEMQRYAMSMFTSCGWFFTDIEGIESVQILRYAARTIELLESHGAGSVRGPFKSILGTAVGNGGHKPTGADIYAAVEAETERG
jgi:alpha-amylase/alpha-mannosidase (GH57 family)